MCELFAVSSESPAKVSYQLSEFATHGGQRYGNRDGWGIAFAQGRDTYLFKEPDAGSSSALGHLVAQSPPLSKLVMAHVRRATAGTPALCNTHPFRRTVAGQARNFAHNGDLVGLKAQYAETEIGAQCVGDTDSELAFMILLDRLARLPQTAAAADRFAEFGEYCQDMRQLGDANFLYAEGEALFVHAHRREYENADGTLTSSIPPGLHLYQVPCEQSVYQVRGASVEKANRGHQILIASVPLDGADWQALPESTTLLVQSGQVVLQAG